jgi:hypothetical protein
VVNLTKPFCWVYVFDGGRKGVKVGISTQRGLAGRLAACRTWSGHKKRDFAKLWHMPRFAYSVESGAKAYFFDQRIRGEWFRVPLVEMVLYVDRAADVYTRRAEYDAQQSGPHDRRA